MSRESEDLQVAGEESGEQLKLSERSPAEPTQTIQERVMVLYNSPSLIEIAIGFWLKVIVEAMIVSLPLMFFLLVPLWVLTWIAVVPLTYFEGVTIWLSLSTTVLLAVWCFTERKADRGG